ncbi:hypothetical protein FGADI_9637 [Fusarium gaditjirri]|uniref:HCNGP-like protein n=1 Tax=Fusarium gaditjirri TaxID=282569 RepID=A0A8H4WSN0_9HYPO|nr:hypothetical protein FGADI_9637 [Fusarium gaditjirri]
MAGLVGYASSDDEEEIQEVNPPLSENKQRVNTTDDKQQDREVKDRTNTSASDYKSLEDDPIGPVQQNAAPLGPFLPPMEGAVIDDQDAASRSTSPYSSNRALLRDLTLPSVPDLNIPPSPPGSPPPGTNKKFEKFLELKKKGTHFNAKLELSTALKNPSLMDKLMRFVEVDEHSQYSTALATDLWNPAAFPEWAFKEKLRKSHDKVLKEKEAERTNGTRTTVEFVPSSTSAGQDTTARSGLLRGEKRKSSWN